MKVFRSLTVAAAIAMVTAACGDSSTGDGAGNGGVGAFGPAAGQPGVPAPVPGAAAPTGVTPGAVQPGTGATGTTGTTGTGEGMPCAIARITQDNCSLCHGATPQFGAQMSLVSHADFHKPAVSNPARMVHELVAERINLTTGARMPPVPNAALAGADLDVMNAWLNSGALNSAEVCAGPATGGAGVGGETVPVGGDTTASGAETDAGVTCYNFVTHAAGDGNASPYQVGIANDAYFNFSFNAPWDGTQYARSFKTIIDNSEVLHHWLFFKEGAPTGNPGAVAPSSGVHPGSELVHGWAPGGDDLIMDADVGFEMPDTAYTLELHYNSSNPSAVDSSGLEVCVTPNMPTNVASISWLGTDAISGTSATGTCRPSSPQRIHILGGTPHMHTHGTHMNVEITRAAGGVETLHDEPFDFNYQVAYQLDTWLEPGDSVKTTCSYNQPVSFGEGTGDEMCYFFTLYYPKLALTDVGLGAVIHGPNTCGVL